MTDLEDFNTVHYRKLLWHFPCYRGLNCPQRHQSPPDAPPDPETPQPGSGRAGFTILEFNSFEDGASFIFLSEQNVLDH